LYNPEFEFPIECGWDTITWNPDLRSERVYAGDEPVASGMWAARFFPFNGPPESPPIYYSSAILQRIPVVKGRCLEIDFAGRSNEDVGRVERIDLAVFSEEQLDDRVTVCRFRENPLSASVYLYPQWSRFHLSCEVEATQSAAELTIFFDEIEQPVLLDAVWVSLLPCLDAADLHSLPDESEHAAGQ